MKEISASAVSGSSRARMRALALLGAAALLGSCASSPARTAGGAVLPAESASAPAVVDDDLLRELTPLVRALIRTGALGSDGQGEAVRIVADRLAAAGLETEVPLVGRGAERNLLARLPGRDAKARPLLLVAHADAFPADPAAWRAEAPPYDATLEGEHLIGRGALDMYGPLALMTLTLVQLARTTTAPNDTGRTRDVLLLVTAGGESDGLGLQQAALRWPRVLDAELALGEGGFLLQDWLRAGEDIVVVSHGEKGRLLLRLSARGERRPVERALPLSAPARLVRALERVLGAHAPARLPDEVMPTAQGLLAAKGGLPALLAETRPGLELLAQGALAGDPLGTPLLASQCALLSLDAGAPTPVVPPAAEAVIDCRLLPGDAPAPFRDRLLLAIDDPRVQLDVLDTSAARASPADGPLLDVVRARLGREKPGAPVLPVLTAAKSQLGLLRARGVAAYGFTPIRVDRYELAAIHGPDERVRVAELEAALPRLVDLVAVLAEGPLLRPAAVR